MSLEEIIDGLRDRSHLEDIRGHGHERVVYINQAVAAVHAAADARTQEIVEWLDGEAPAVISNRDAAAAIARRFPNGTSDESAGA